MAAVIVQMAAAIFLRQRESRLRIEQMILMRHFAVPLLMPLAGLSAQHPAHESPRSRSDSLSVMATLLTTTVSPALGGRSRSELQVTQPMVALRGARFGNTLQYVTMLNFERWTMPDGEAVAGIWARDSSIGGTHTLWRTSSCSVPHGRLASFRGPLPWARGLHRSEPMIRWSARSPSIRPIITCHR